MFGELDVLPVMEDPSRPKYRDVNPLLLKPPFRLAIVGASKSGKSNYLMNLFREKYYGGKKPCFNKIVVFSPNLGLDSTTRAMKDIAGEENISMTYKDSMLQNLFDRQKAMGDDRDRVLVIADDLIALGCSPLSLIFTASTYARHLDISIIYLTQTFSGHYSIPPVVKQNLEGCIMFRSPSNRQIEAFSDDLQGTFGEKRSIKAMLEDTTREPFHFGFFNYRDLEVYHNHSKMIWKKFDDNGNYMPDYVRSDKQINKNLKTNKKDETEFDMEEN